MRNATFLFLMALLYHREGVMSSYVFVKSRGVFPDLFLLCNVSVRMAKEK